MVNALGKEAAQVRVMEPALGVEEPVAGPLFNHEA